MSATTPVKEINNEPVFTGHNKPELLMITQVLPFPADAGPKIKTFNLLRYLSQYYSISLVSFVRSDNTAAHIAELKKYCREVHTVLMKRSKVKDVLALARSLPGKQPFLMVRDDVPEMRNLLRELTARKNFAAVHADQLNMGQYALPLSIPVKVLDEHNAVWTIADRLRKGQKNPLKKMVLRLESFKLRKYEQAICKKFEAVLAVSAEDETALGLPCHIIPIGVDAEGIEPLKLTPDSTNLVSLGTMFYPPNIEGALWFAREVFPLIQKERPEATYTIIGARPPEVVRQLTLQNPGIRVAGYVEDLRPVLQTSAGLVVPLLSGGGMRVKILDALALGLPIVSTGVGAEGIELEDGKNVLLADTPQEFAGACLKLLEPTEVGENLAQAGRKLALEKYDFRVAYRPINAIYQKLIFST
jgi:glycosyltransferase involved in cell wall biosynthesis